MLKSCNTKLFCFTLCPSVSSDYLSKHGGITLQTRANVSARLQGAEAEHVELYMKQPSSDVQSQQIISQSCIKSALQMGNVEEITAQLCKSLPFFLDFVYCAGCCVYSSCVQGHYTGILLRHESIIMNYSAPALMASNRHAEPAQ